MLKKMLLSGAPLVDLRRFLPPPESPHRRAVLHELIKTELEARYSRGQRCRLEEFLQKYPELGGSENVPASLIYDEYRVRRMFGDCSDLEEYRARFPAQFEQFQKLVRVQAPRESPPILCHSSGTSLTSSSETLSPELPSRAPTVTPPAQSSLKPAGVLSKLVPGGEGYQLLERIGKGQYGEVYRALAPGGVVVAVKRIFRSMDDETSQRELKALQTIRELRHPFLLQTHNFQAFEDRLLIVMELADGSLEERLKECLKAGLPGIPLEELLCYFSEAAEALDFLHQQKLSHRDIKPQNLLHMKGHAKVADFGIARPQLSAVDHTFHVGGTPAYMPPETWNGKISLHSDQYSFALTWYEMRTSRRAFNGKTQIEVAEQHLNEKPDLSGVPVAEQRVLHRALAKDPGQRFPSCVVFVQALKEALTPSQPKRPGQGWGGKLVAASLVVALAAVLTTVYVVLWPQPPQSAQGVPEPGNIMVSWQPKDWEPVDATDLIEDRSGRRYYRRLVRKLGLQKVVMVAVRKTSPADPATFYAMENKVWNDLYAVFMADPRAKQLLQKYSEGRPGCKNLVRGEWQKGGWASNSDTDPDKEPFGVEGPEKGRLPVFRVTVTEAHCFAEWLGGRLPTRRQWRKAAGWEEDSRQGPFDGDPQNTGDLAVHLKEGPWPVDRGKRDVSNCGCRQMASNGYEWTRDLDDNGEIPLEQMLSIRHVYTQGQTYLSDAPLIFQAMAESRTQTCIEALYEVSFRVVLEQ
jgi:hypothetical protein